MDDKIKVSKIKGQFSDETIMLDSITKEKSPLVSRDVRYCQMGKEKKVYTATYLAVILVIACITIDLYILVKYATGEYYSRSVNVLMVQSITVIVFMTTGIFIHTIFVNREFKIEDSPEYMIQYIGMGIGVGLVGIIFQNVMRGIVFSISPIDYFLFFITVGVGEELLFRFGILPSIKTIFNFNETFASFIAIFGSSAIFTLYHIFVYQSSDLLIVFIIGVLLGFLFEYSKAIDTSIIAHIMLNIIGGIAVINEIFGGF